MDWLHILSLPFRLGFLLAGLLAPGALLLRAFGLPRSLSGSFIASAVALHGVVLALAFTGSPIGPVSLAGGLLAIATVAIFAARGKPKAAVTEEGLGMMFTRWSPWALLYGAVWLVLLYRLGTQPLTGPDIGFRWSWLAEQMLRQGSLDFYPPHSAADFTEYFWAESIPPGVAGLYAWSYACGGSFAPPWTSPVVLLQFLALHDLVWRLAYRSGGESAARYAVLLLAVTPLLNWSVIIGQETGLTAIGVCGLAYALSVWANEKQNSWLVLAGLSGALVAGAREYGVVYAAVGGAVLLLWRAPMRALLVYSACAFTLAVAWLGFVWMKTGNPVYSLNVAGLFPVNEVFDRYTSFVRLLQSTGLATSDGLFQLARYLVLFALPACFGVALALWRVRTGFTLAAIFILTSAVLWIMSVGYTAGGLFYSMRVLSPALALAAAFGGVALATMVENSRAQHFAHLLLLGLGLESLPKTLTLPVNPYRRPPAGWLAAGGEFVGQTAKAEDELRDFLRTLPARHTIITESASLQRLLADDGLVVSPIWSPDNAWLFDCTPNAETFGAHVRSAPPTLLVLTRDSHGARFVQQFAHPSAGTHLHLVRLTSNFVVYRFGAPTQP